LQDGWGSRDATHVTVALLILATGTGWPAITVAALTSSAVGAICGSILTTRQQSRHAREEAWRTRLIEAADDLNQLLVQGLSALGTLSARLGRGDLLQRDGAGVLNAECAQETAAIRTVLDQGRVQLARLELLMSVDADAYQQALESMSFSRQALGLIEGHAQPQSLVEAVITASREQRADVPLESPGTTSMERAIATKVLSHDSLPSDFDPTDTRNVVSWVDVFREYAGEDAHDFMRGAHAYIEKYQLPN
jgi:hypothetical protein